MEHFGKLMGLMNFAAGVFQLLQFPLLIWAENQTFTQVKYTASINLPLTMTLIAAKQSGGRYSWKN